METPAERRERARAVYHMGEHMAKGRGMHTILAQQIIGDGDYIPGQDDGEWNEPKDPSRYQPTKIELTYEELEQCIKLNCL